LTRKRALFAICVGGKNYNFNKGGLKFHILSRYNVDSVQSVSQRCCATNVRYFFSVTLIFKTTIQKTNKYNFPNTQGTRSVYYVTFAFSSKYISNSFQKQNGQIIIPVYVRSSFALGECIFYNFWCHSLVGDYYHGIYMTMYNISYFLNWSF